MISSSILTVIPCRMSADTENVTGLNSPNRSMISLKVSTPLAAINGEINARSQRSILGQVSQTLDNQNLASSPNQSHR